MMNGKHHGQQHHRQYRVCDRAGHGNDQPLPARMAQKLAFVDGRRTLGRTLFRHLDGVHPGHLHVAAQRQG